MNIFDYFREAFERRAAGHTLHAWADVLRRKVGWEDLTEGYQTQVSVRQIREMFASDDCRDAPWERLNLTVEDALDIITTPSGRGRFFGNGSEEGR